MGKCVSANTKQSKEKTGSKMEPVVRRKDDEVVVEVKATSATDNKLNSATATATATDLLQVQVQKQPSMELETRQETAQDNMLEEIDTTVDDSQLFQAVKTVPQSNICL